MPFPWRRDGASAVEISYEFPPPASRDSDDEDEPHPEDIDFYESALKEMRARRTSKKDPLKRKKSGDSTSNNNGMDNSGTTTLDTTDESAASIQSFLSWASNTSNISQDPDEKQAEQYWRDRARGRVPTRRHTDGSLQSYLGKFAGNNSNSPRDLNSSLSMLETSSLASGTSSASAAAAKAEHQDSFRQLQYSKEDLQFLAFGENRDFHKLQKSLRREGAITNELLKQVLPMVVSQSSQRRKTKQVILEQQKQQALSKILEMEPDDQARKAATVLLEEKKEELAY